VNGAILATGFRQSTIFLLCLTIALIGCGRKQNTTSNSAKPRPTTDGVAPSEDKEEDRSHVDVTLPESEPERSLQLDEGMVSNANSSEESIGRAIPAEHADPITSTESESAEKSEDV